MTFLLNIEKLWVPVPTPSPTLWRSFALSRPPVVPLQRKCFIGWNLRSRDSRRKQPLLTKGKSTGNIPNFYVSRCLTVFNCFHLSRAAWEPCDWWVLTPSHIVQSTLSIATQNDFSWNMVYLLNICRYKYIIYIIIYVWYVMIAMIGILHVQMHTYVCKYIYIYIYICTHVYTHSCHPFCPRLWSKLPLTYHSPVEKRPGASPQ